VVARKNHRADRSQGRLRRLGWLTGRDDDGVHDLVGGPGDLFAPALPGGTLPEGAVPEPGGRERIALQLRVLDNVAQSSSS